MKEFQLNTKKDHYGLNELAVCIEDARKQSKDRGVTVVVWESPTLEEFGFWDARTHLRPPYMDQKSWPLICTIDHGIVEFFPNQEHRYMNALKAQGATVETVETVPLAVFDAFCRDILNPIVGAL